MGEQTGISWTDATFNPWWGCVRVSPGCENCYAETLSKRYGHAVWGPAKTTTRRHMSEAYWKAPERWNADPAKHHPQAVAEGRNARVFCASMADVFEDHPAVVEARARLFELIEATPNLDWQLLTKRPENILGMVPPAWAEGFPDNVWIGTSAEDRRRLEERVPWLVGLPARVRFLSCEPLLEDLDLRPHLWRPMALEQIPGWALNDGCTEGVERRGELHWVIVGGESGHGARLCDLGWIRDLVRQSRDAGVAVFVKQVGSRPCAWMFNPNAPALDDDLVVFAPPNDRKGGDPEEWPADLRVREFPEVRA